jgi:putative FmdB family regulatory protein
MMPIYKYRCPKCGGETLEIRMIKEADAPVKCPDCGAEMKRVFGTVKLDFRGSGFQTKKGIK